MISRIERLAARVLASEKLGRDECAEIFEAGERSFSELLFFADKIREKFKGRKVRLCSIINAKSGMCSEDCGFCAQGARSSCDVSVYPFVPPERVEDAYLKVSSSGASCFGIVASGRSPGEEDIESAGRAIEKISRLASEKAVRRRAKISASLGEATRGQLEFLKKRGLKKYHHNLETSRRYFGAVCSTHSYDDRLRTLAAVKEAGLELCCGGLFGIGETTSDRLELALALRDINPDSVPLNFYNPVKGTPFEGVPRLSCREILSTISAFRFVLPDKSISVCGGREANLRDMQSWIFYAGADGMMTGGYLTTPGRSSEEDKRMLADLGFEIAP